MSGRAAAPNGRTPFAIFAPTKPAKPAACAGSRRWPRTQAARPGLRFCSAPKHAGAFATVGQFMNKKSPIQAECRWDAATLDELVAELTAAAAGDAERILAFLQEIGRAS